MHVAFWVFLTLVVPLSPLLFAWLFSFLCARSGSTIDQILGDGQVIFFAVAVFAAAYADSLDRCGDIWTATRGILGLLACCSAVVYGLIAFDRLHTDTLISSTRAAFLSSVAAGVAVVGAITIHVWPSTL